MDDGKISSMSSPTVTITPAAPTGWLMGINPANNTSYTNGTLAAVPLDGKGKPAVIVAPGTTIQFQNVSDPSTADTDKLTYSWSVNGGDPQTTSINEFELPSYTVGTMTQVTATIISPTKIESQQQIIDVYVNPNLQSGTFVLSNGIPPAGTFLPDGKPAPDDYDPYGPPIININNFPAGQAQTFTFTPNQATEALLPEGNKVQYIYGITVGNTSPSGWNQLLGLYSWNPYAPNVIWRTDPWIITTDPHVTFDPAKAPDSDSANRVIAVTCTAVYPGGIPNGSGTNYYDTLTTLQKPGFVHK